jgi:hypothetical protein
VSSFSAKQACKPMGLAWTEQSSEIQRPLLSCQSRFANLLCLAAQGELAARLSNSEG